MENKIKRNEREWWVNLNYMVALESGLSWLWHTWSHGGRGWKQVGGEGRGGGGEGRGGGEGIINYEGNCKIGSSN